MNTLALYKATLRIRRIEEAIAAKYSEQKMRCPTHLSVGQELPPVVLSSFLTHEDKAYSSHRAHAHYLAKGGSLLKLIAELYGKETGSTGGRGGSMHLTDLASGFIASTAIVGNSIPLAVGNALHQKLNQQSHLTVSYFGEGATEEGAFYEAINFAVVKQLPILFACENNAFSVYSPLDVRQPQSRKIHQLAREIGADSCVVDGNQPESTYQAVQNAVSYIRNKQGPYFIEFMTYRHREHCGPNFDDDLNYRPKKDVDYWLENDPISNLETLLSDSQDWKKTKRKIEQDIQDEINVAFEYAEQSSFAPLESIGDCLYAR
ncbi:thiamine pyrophosphate-dependent dehydrogenase E1 component subunit alpha [Alteromonas sp.]|uniref:thiamine pyrophosphate-dependent dehydrogenase E1 component subunit alpha n=1 Tax=Alteromonas sp. TaxID=232 RepID=UPI00257CDBDC|nr:thiamine pyrophosphate-dependent dehydrogenase E1 component subunit alpha [Alteromonas sp.]NQY17558.1 thiamine pyrophosphate-dependent dehydrogenase E1 component subunit alpha [Alteromonas sp.]